MAIAFCGISGAYALFDSLYFIEHRTRGEAPLWYAIGFPLVVALGSVVIAYGRWIVRKLGDRSNVRS